MSFPRIVSLTEQLHCQIDQFRLVFQILTAANSVHIEEEKKLLMISISFLALNNTDSIRTKTTGA